MYIYVYVNAYMYVCVWKELKRKNKGKPKKSSKEFSWNVSWSCLLSKHLLSISIFKNKNPNHVQYSRFK